MEDETVTLDFTEPEAREWKKGPSLDELYPDQSEQKEQVLHRYVDRVMAHSGCSEEEAQDAIDEFGMEQFWSERKRAIKRCDNAEIWGLERYRIVQDYVGYQVSVAVFGEPEADYREAADENWDKNRQN